MIIYNDNFTTLSSHEAFIAFEVEYIIKNINANTKKVIHEITIYKPSTLLFSTFVIHFFS